MGAVQENSQMNDHRVFRLYGRQVFLPLAQTCNVRYRPNQGIRLLPTRRPKCSATPPQLLRTIEKS